MAVDVTWVLDLAASLPESGERDYREEATIFTFRGRGIGYVSADGRELFVKSTRADRAALVGSRPEVFSEWYTSGRFGWVRVLLARVDHDEVRELVVEAWRLTAPERMVRAFDEMTSRPTLPDSPPVSSPPGLPTRQPTRSPSTKAAIRRRATRASGTGSTG
jgi:hypothetical protein